MTKLLTPRQAQALRAVHVRHSPPGPSEVAGDLGLTRQRAHSLLSTLVTLGCLARTPQGLVVTGVGRQALRHRRAVDRLIGSK